MLVFSPLRSPLQPVLASPFSRRFSPGYSLDFRNAATLAALGFERTGLGTLIDGGGLVAYGDHNLLLNSATLSTQNVTTVAQQYTLEFSGAGTVTLSGTGSGVLSAGTNTFTATAGTLTLTVSGSVTAAQLNAGASATAYVETTSAARYLPRITHSPVALYETLGLLVEPQVTQLLNNGGLGGAMATQTVTVTAAAHTLHFTGTGTVTLSGVSTAGPLVGTGTGETNRVSLTFTPTAGSLTLTVSGTVTNAQLEAGSVATSYIPNSTSGSLVCAADEFSITGASFTALMGPLLAAGQGTLVFEFIPVTATTPSSPQVLALIYDGSAINTPHTLAITTNYEGKGFVSNLAASAITANIVTSNARSKLGVTFGPGGLKLCVNGGAVASTANTAFTGVGSNTMSFDDDGQIWGPMPGIRSRITVYPTAVADAALQALSAL